jgi:hypothetical protein
VASQLLKYCHFLEDVEGHRMELRFFRDVDKREVDFLVLRGGKALFAVECKTGERAPSPHAAYLAERVRMGDVYQVHQGKRDYLDRSGRLRVLPFDRFCKELGMP